MAENKRSTYECCRIIREALDSPLFAPGEYAYQEIMERIVKAGLLHPWEISVAGLTVQAKKEGWIWNGKSARGSRLIKPIPQVEERSPATPLPFEEEDAPKGKFTRKIERIETMLETILSSLQLPIPREED